MEVSGQRGSPNRKVIFQNRPVSFYDCWREGTVLALRTSMALHARLRHETLLAECPQPTKSSNESNTPSYNVPH